MTRRAAASPDRDKLLTGAFVTLWFVAFLQEMAFGLMVHLPGYLAELGATESRIGLAFAAGAVVALVLRPMMGRIIDGWGRKRVILVACLVFVGSMLAFIPLNTFGPPAYVVTVVYMTSEILLFTSVLALGADVIPPARRTEGLGLLGISGLLPIGLGSILGDVVLGGGSYTRLFLVASSLAALAWLVAWRLPKGEPEDQSGQAPFRFLAVLTQRDLGPAWLITAAFALAMTILFTFTRTYVDATGVGSVGLFFGVYAGVAIVARLAASRTADRSGAVAVLVPATIAVAVQFFLLASFPTTAGMVAAAVLGGAGHGLIFPVLTAMVVDRAPDGARGSALAAFSGVFDLVLLVAAPAVGLLIERQGYGPAYAVVGAGVLVGLAGFVWWDRAVRPPVTAGAGLPSDWRRIQ